MATNATVRFFLEQAVQYQNNPVQFQSVKFLDLRLPNFFYNILWEIMFKNSWTSANRHVTNVGLVFKFRDCRRDWQLCPKVELKLL